MMFVSNCSVVRGEQHLSTIFNKLLLVACLLPCLVFSLPSLAKENSEQLPVRGFAIAAPSPEKLDDFISFINDDLAKTSINKLFVRINYGYQFKSYPELAEKGALSEKQVKLIIKAAGQHNIELVPIINLLGHQSWKQDNIRSLLKVYPQFEENPGKKLFEKDFYTRAYCPNHPDVHEVVFSLVDEIAQVFESKAIHVGLDEVFILGEDGCPRCKGQNKAELFANEVNLIQAHLAKQNLAMYMWGDRLIDGKTTGLGKWAASENDTHSAIDLISKDITIIDWQYKTAPPTPGYFALKGFNVISASHHVPEVAQQQVSSMLALRATNNDTIKNRLNGVMHTFWGSFNSFNQCYKHNECKSEKIKGAIETFNYLLPKKQQ